MRYPIVSIIVPTYNRAHVLPRAIDSIIAQTTKHWEIVLVDDGSTDATREVAAEYQRRLSERFKYIRQANQGASRARNHGIDAAQGRYVAFLDSDDEFLPTKLERQLALFDVCPSLGFVYSDFSFVEVNGKKCNSAFDEHHPLARDVRCTAVGSRLCRCTRSLFDVLIQGYFICTIVGMVRRSVLGSTIRFPEGECFGEEWLFYLRVARACDSGFVDEPLSIYHHQVGSLARTDRDKNVETYRRLLKSIDAEFGGLSRHTKKTTLGHLGLLERQLGCTAHKAGRFRDAAKHFNASLCHEFRWRTLGHSMQAIVQGVTLPLRKMGRSGGQAGDVVGASD